MLLRTRLIRKVPTFCVECTIAAAVQILGHGPLWKRIFTELGLEINENLLNILMCRDKTKMQKKMRAQTEEGKTMKSTVKYENLGGDHKAQIEDLKKGDMYESGIAVTAAQKNLKAAPKRNEGPTDT